MRALSWFLIVAFWMPSCRAAPDPAERGARALPGTEGAAYMGGDPLSVSPSSRWVLFSREREVSPEADVAAMSVAWLRGYALYDRDTGQVLDPDVDAEALRAHFDRSGALLQTAGCWPTGGNLVVLSGAFGRYVDLDVDGDPPRWVASSREPFSLASACPRRPDPRERFGRWGSFVVERTRGDGIRIRADDPARVLADHRGRWPWQSLVLGDVALSPDGRDLAYVVSTAWGSWVGPAVAYVVTTERADSGPTVLGGPTLSLRWSPDGAALLGYAAVHGPGTYAIVEWERDSLF